MLTPAQQYLGKISQPCLFHLYLKLFPCLLILSKHFFSWSKVNQFLRKREPGARFPFAEKLKGVFSSVMVLGQISLEALRVEITQKIVFNGANILVWWTLHVNRLHLFPPVSQQWILNLICYHQEAKEQLLRFKCNEAFLKVNGLLWAWLVIFRGTHLLSFKFFFCIANFFQLLWTFTGVLFQSLFFIFFFAFRCFDHFFLLLLRQLISFREGIFILRRMRSERNRNYFLTNFYFPPFFIGFLHQLKLKILIFIW